jgi:hypothetical protein
MTSGVLLFVALLVSPAGRWSVQPPVASGTANADELYAARESPAQAAQAEAIWAERLVENPRDFESAWKLARARYWLGGHAPEAERRTWLEAGIGSSK